MDKKAPSGNSAFSSNYHLEILSNLFELSSTRYHNSSVPIWIRMVVFLGSRKGIDVLNKYQITLTKHSVLHKRHCYGNSWAGILIYNTWTSALKRLTAIKIVVRWTLSFLGRPCELFRYASTISIPMT